MNIDALRDLVGQRRSIRGYDEKRDVTDEMIRAILNCARWAHCGGNGQPWEFIVVARGQLTTDQNQKFEYRNPKGARVEGSGCRGEIPHPLTLVTRHSFCFLVI
jgi:hypothetical protein